MASRAKGGTARARFSDDDLLATVHQLGLRAAPAALCRTLSARSRRQLRPRDLTPRLERLSEEGVLRLAPGATANEAYVRLTAAGVERLQALQREPMKPATPE